MNWTEEAKRQLSREVAEKFDVQMYLPSFDIQAKHPDKLYNGQNFINLQWLVDDWHEIMELCVKHGVYAKHDADFVSANYGVSDNNFETWADVDYASCNNDPSLAERIARLMALREVTV